MRFRPTNPESLANPFGHSAEVELKRMHGDSRAPAASATTRARSLSCSPRQAHMTAVTSVRVASSLSTLHSSSSVAPYCETAGSRHIRPLSFLQPRSHKYPWQHSQPGTNSHAIGKRYG